MSGQLRQGDRVETPEGPGTVVGPFLSRGLRRVGRLDEEGWIVALDRPARRRVFLTEQLTRHNERGKA